MESLALNCKPALLERNSNLWPEKRADLIASHSPELSSLERLMILDFHNHYFPPEYLDAIRSGGSHFQVTSDDDGNPVLGYPGDHNVVVPGHRDIERRIRDLDAVGVDHQILTFVALHLAVDQSSHAVFVLLIEHIALGLAQSLHPPQIETSR